jgi:Uma2 family endonuclease
MGAGIVGQMSGDSPLRADLHPRTLLLQQPEDRDFEVVGGVLVERETARFEHGYAQLCLGAALGRFNRRSGDDDGPGGWWIAVEVEVEYASGDIYRHDLAGWRRDRTPARPSGRCVSTRPDWVCEVVSPSNWSRDTVTKFQTLQATGVPHYWVVDLEHGVLTVYRFGGKVYEVAQLAQPGQRLRLEPFDAHALDISVLFGLESPAAPPGS